MYSRLDMKGIRGPMCRNVYQKPRGWLPVDKTFAGDQRFKLSTVSHPKSPADPSSEVRAAFTSGSFLPRSADHK